jgi:hypothetical protein
MSRITRDSSICYNVLLFTTDGFPQMITRIELTNFMSHRHTVIEPARGLTVLIGPNNVGKSAIVAALQILCNNGNSTYVMRHGERECSVVVETDDGRVIQWRRKNSPSYTVDGQRFDRLGRNGVPEEVCKALRLGKVEAAVDSEFAIHFGTQKSPIFLLADPPSAAARFFASSSDAIRFLEVQKRHKDKLLQAQRKKGDLEAESRKLNSDLQLLEPVVDIDRRLEQAEQEHRELMDFADWLVNAERHLVLLEQQNAVVARSDAFVGGMASLSGPPRMMPLEPLSTLIEKLNAERRIAESASSHADALLALAAPPKLPATDPLAGLIGKLVATGAAETTARLEASAAESLVPPPCMSDAESLRGTIERIATAVNERAIVERRIAALSAIARPPLATTIAVELAIAIDKLEAAGRQVELCAAALTAATDDCVAAGSELRHQADGRRCTACGAPLDPDRVLAEAIAGGHRHD